MFMPSATVREMIADPGQIKSAWLGAEACVHLAPRTLAGNRFMLWSRGLPGSILMFSFLSGLVIGGYLAVFARGQLGSRHCRVEYGKVTPCLE